MSLKNQTERKDQVQCLRFLVFLHIFEHHAGRYWNFLPIPINNMGMFGVSFFFMLSGMLVGYKAYGKSVSPTPRAILYDMGKRVRKYYPLHLVTTVFSVITTGVLMYLVNDLRGAVPHMIQLVKNLLLVHAWFPNGCLSYNGVSWYLSALLSLSLLNLPVAALLQKIRAKKRGNWIFVGIIAILFAATVAYQYFTVQPDNGFDFQYYFPVSRVGQYTIAMITGFMVRGWEIKYREKKQSKILFTVAELFALVLWVAVLTLQDDNWIWYTSQVAWIIPILYILSVFMIGRGWVSHIFRCKILTYLGDVSFECYMVHMIIILLVSMERPDFLYGKVVCTLFALGYTFIVSMFLYNLSKNGKKKS